MTTNTTTLPADAVRRLLNLRDLTDPDQGDHAMQRIVERIEAGVARATGVPVHRHRTSPVVTVADNYDRLGYLPDAAARDARHSRYLRADIMLRAHTSAAMPLLHERVAAGELHPGEGDLVLAVPGLVYRRDVVDRHHVGEPHQLDLWRLRRGGRPLGEEELDEQIATVAGAVLPGRPWRTEPRSHPYTTSGRQVDVLADDGTWMEIGECGLTHPGMLHRTGLDPRADSGLAMGLGLDRLVMLAKGIDDIRLLRSEDPRVASQLLDLEPYEPVSSMPRIRRDLSIAVGPDLDDELLGDRVRAALGDATRAIESIEVGARTSVAELPEAARRRLGARPEQVNLLVRVCLRDLERTLTSAEANLLRDRIYAALHEGDVHRWACGGPPVP
jgi:phenylalanyl-tRNA synthetase alpha chain